MRANIDILSERLHLVGEAAKLNAEHVRLMQMAAGVQIATMGDETADDTNPHQAAIEAVEAKLRALEDKIADLDKELDSQ
ncbi:MAG: hypothetical protein AAGD34_02235 [Pseudomonadota bacterium]